MRALHLVLGVLMLCCAARASAAEMPHAAASVITILEDGIALGGIQLVVQAGLDRQSAGQSGIAALAAECVLRTPSEDGTLRETVRRAGGELDYTVEGHAVHYYLESNHRLAPHFVGLLASALRAPDFTAATLEAAKHELLLRAAEDEDYPITLGLQMLRRAATPTSNAGLPPFGTATTVPLLTSQDVRSFFARYYVRGRALVVAEGNLEGAQPAEFTPLIDALGTGTTAAVHVKGSHLTGTERTLIARRDVAAEWIVAGINAPSPRERDFGPMLVMQAFLESTLEESGVTTKSFAERNAGTNYAFDERPITLAAYVSGLRSDPMATFVTARSILFALADHGIPASVVARFRSVARGRFLIETQTVQARSWYAASFFGLGLGTDFRKRTLAAIDATTPRDLARVIRRYLPHTTFAIVLPRAASGAPSS